MDTGNIKKINRHKIFLLFILFIFSSAIFSLADAQKKNAISYNKEGREYLARGDQFRAILSFKNALKQNPRYKDAILGLGKAYLKTEAFPESVNLFSDVLKLDKNNIEAVNGLGFAMTELGKYNDALEYFKTALTISEADMEAKYGIAYIYYLMDRNIWAKRQLADILKVNPYHYESLLLMADIKIREKRDGEAKQYVQKAIDSKNDLPDAYVKYGRILMKDFKESQDAAYMTEAADKLRKALAIHPENLSANRNMGNLFFLQKSYDEALKYFNRTITDYPENGISYYNMAITYANMNDSANAINYFLRAMKISPSDSILKSRLEDFLVLNDFAEGHPLRVKFSEEHYRAAIDKLKISLVNDAVMRLQRSLLLNPLNRISRESLRDLYQTFNYNELYVNEQKTLFSLYPENKYQDMLKVAIIKRRDRLYHKAGYSTELPPRDVPRILVLDFSPLEPVSLHPDAGEVIANHLTFALGQFGRMQPVSVRKRMETAMALKDDRQFLGDNLEIIADMARQGKTDKPDFVVFGNYREGMNFLSIDFELMDFNTGVITNNFSISENGKESLPDIAIRAANRLYNAIPFKGRVLDIRDDNVIVNLGLIDGIKPGDFIVIYKLDSSEDKDLLRIKKKLTLQVNNADTMISSAKPMIAVNAEDIDVNDVVYPYQKRRAKLIK
ncbi:MAG: tetratricopeptide repeat protein [Spirochaetes bacterium]|nr:tetratricopeptide repeat protein [Spirochaetota bacterium]